MMVALVYNYHMMWGQGKTNTYAHRYTGVWEQQIVSTLCLLHGEIHNNNGVWFKQKGAAVLWGVG